MPLFSCYYWPLLLTLVMPVKKAVVLSLEKFNLGQKLKLSDLMWIKMEVGRKLVVVKTLSVENNSGNQPESEKDH